MPYNYEKLSFERIYETKLLPIIKSMEKERSIKHQRIIIWRITIAIIMFGVLIYASDNAAIILISIIVGSSIIGIIPQLVAGDYIAKFKLSVLDTLVTSIHDKLSYRPTQYIPRFIFDRSQIFGHYNRYYGQDLIRGNINDVNFMFSELNVFHKSGSGKNETIITIFNGIFVEFEFNKNFSSKLLIYPDFAERYFGNFGIWLQSLNFTKDDLVYTDNMRFEKEFVVYGNDQIEARYLLTPYILQEMLKLRMKLNMPIYFSFSNSRFYLALEYGNGNYLEPDLSSQTLNKETLLKHFHDVTTVINVVQDFKLDQFLWEKLSPKEKEALEEKNSLTKPQIVSNIPITNQKNHQPRVNKDAELFKTYYEILQPLLKPLESYRLKTLSLQILYVIGIVSVFLLLASFIDDWGVSGGIGFLVYFSILYMLFYIAQSYVERYKKDVVGPLHSFLNPELIYKPYTTFTDHILYKAHLFPNWDQLTGGDFFEGKIGTLNVEASQLTLSIDDKEIFGGYIFILDLKTPNKEDFRLFPPESVFDTYTLSNIKQWPHLSKLSRNYMRSSFLVYNEGKEDISLFNETFVRTLISIKQELDIDNIFMSHQDNKLYLGFDLDGRTLFDVEVTKSVYKKSKDIEFFISFYQSVEHLIKSIAVK